MFTSLTSLKNSSIFYNYVVTGYGFSQGRNLLDYLRENIVDREFWSVLRRDNELFFRDWSKYMDYFWDDLVPSLATWVNISLPSFGNIERLVS